MNIHMALLLAVMATAFIFEWLGAKHTQKTKRNCIIVITVIITLFSGLRTWWFGDLIKYYTLFTKCNSPDWQNVVFETIENSGIRIFFKLIGGLNLPYEVCIFLISAFSASALALLVYRYSPSTYWSYVIWIAVGFYMFTYSGLKQTIAMGFVMFAMIGVIERRFWLFLFMVLTAGLFHVPALIFLIAYPYANQSSGRASIFTIIILIAAMYLLRNTIVGMLVEAYYSDGSDIIAPASGIGGRFILMIAMLIGAAIVRPIKFERGPYPKVFFIMVLACAIQLYSIYDNVFTRLADYFFQMSVLFVPMMLSPNTEDRVYYEWRPSYKIIDAKMYVILSIFVTAFALWFYNSTLEGCSQFLSGYKFIWEINANSLYGT